MKLSYVSMFEHEECLYQKKKQLKAVRVYKRFWVTLRATYHECVNFDAHEH